MKTIRAEVDFDAKFLTNRWGGELVESDLARALISARENQREADCKTLCTYCGPDGYGPAYRLGGDAGWEHRAKSDNYIPELAPCGASAIRESWFESFAPTINQIANDCANAIMDDIPTRQGFDKFWHDIDDDTMAEIRRDWGLIIKDAIETYQREGMR